MASDRLNPDDYKSPIVQLAARAFNADHNRIEALEQEVRNYKLTQETCDKEAAVLKDEIATLRAAIARRDAAHEHDMAALREVIKGESQAKASAQKELDAAREIIRTLEQTRNVGRA